MTDKIQDYKIAILQTTKGLTHHQRTELHKQVREIFIGVESCVFMVPTFMRGTVPVIDEAVEGYRHNPRVAFMVKMFARNDTKQVDEWIRCCDHFLAFPSRSRQLGITSDRVWTVVRGLQKQKRHVNIVYPWANQNAGDLLLAPIK